jgi:rhamnogalacturonan endolyase
LISDDWTKLDGPFLLYFNEGKNIAGIWNDAKAKAEIEKKQWPYGWMEHSEYPLQRGTVRGRLLIDDKPAHGAQVLLAQPGVDWQAQSRDYIFAGRAGIDGIFSIDHVRPGTYSLYAFGANSTDEFQKASIEVVAGKILNLQDLKWQTANAGRLLWQIGIADRKTTGFKLADSKRDYSLFKQPPADFVFSVGKNKTVDWYYAQTKKGSWDIGVDVDESFTGQALLTLGIAGSAKNPALEVWINGNNLGSYRFGNDASVYRSAVAGGYYQKQVIPFPSYFFKKESNIVSLKLPDVKDGGGIMYDVIKLEAN